MTNYAFCEPVSATVRSREHIRRTNGPLKLGGGIEGVALCGYDVNRGWDLAVPVAESRIDTSAEVNPTCSTCADIWRRELAEEQQ